MNVKINKNGEVEVVVRKKLNEGKMKSIIKKVITGGKSDSEQIHDRWTALYNAYDMLYDTDVRQDHGVFNSESYSSVSRLQYLALVEKLDQLFYVTAKLYKIEFEEIIENYLEIA